MSETRGGVRGLEWMSAGECRSNPAEGFFSSDGTGVEIAKRICQECVVRDVCLEYALTNRIDHGVWGGTSERERRRILRWRKRGIDPI